LDFFHVEMIGSGARVRVRGERDWLKLSEDNNSLRNESKTRQDNAGQDKTRQDRTGQKTRQVKTRQVKQRHKQDNTK
jgi:hypothetical protein